MKFNDPYQLLLAAVKNIYGYINVNISFDPTIRKRFFWGYWGVTDFDCTPVEIRISAHLPVFHSLEILAHELAHAIVGYEEGHNKKWEECFDKIHQEHQRLLRKEYDDLIIKKRIKEKIKEGLKRKND